MPGNAWRIEDIPINAPQAVKDYPAKLDGAAFGAASDKHPKFVSASDPAAQWTGAHKGPTFFAYATNYLFDTENAVMVDVEATRAMIERTMDRFGLYPATLAGDTAYGAADMRRMRK